MIRGLLLAWSAVNESQMGDFNKSSRRCSEPLRQPCALLDICSRTIVAHFSAISVYRRILKRAPKNPQTLGEHLRLARIDRALKQTELAQLLGVVYQTVEKWEHNLVPMSPKSRARVVAFLGYDPAAPDENPTADSIGN
jgi:DNA-binding XRE family transcriptional regulator